VTLVKYSNAMRYIHHGSGRESHLPSESLCLFLCGLPVARISCYGLKTDLTPAQAPKELVHDRYQDLAAVEHAFRTCKTAHLDVCPIFLRRAASTRAPAFGVLLAYQLIQ
jgi:hypothetical protein